MKISITTVPHKMQRYDTAGDYYESSIKPGHWFISVSNLNNERMEYLVALHEFVEMGLTKFRGISDSVITLHDESHPDSDEPGALPDAPYRKEHECATAIEIIMAQQLGVDWIEYDNRVKEL